MRPIKFRGRNVTTGEYVYGGLTSKSDLIVTDSLGRIVSWAVIKPDTVAQLVGYDSNGKEVYEGDKLIDKTFFAQECTATLVSEVEYTTGGGNDLNDSIHTFTLKEEHS